jgi:hypothetical protein
MASPHSRRSSPILAGLIRAHLSAQGRLADPSDVSFRLSASMIPLGLLKSLSASNIHYPSSHFFRAVRLADLSCLSSRASSFSSAAMLQSTSPEPTTVSMAATVWYEVGEGNSGTSAWRLPRKPPAANDTYKAVEGRTLAFPSSVQDIASDRRRVYKVMNPFCVRPKQ